MRCHHASSILHRNDLCNSHGRYSTSTRTEKDGNQLAFQYKDRYPECNFLNHFMVILPLAFDRDYVDYLYVEPVQY